MYLHPSGNSQHSGSFTVPHLVLEEGAKAHPDDKGDKDAGHIVVICAGILLPVALE